MKAYAVLALVRSRLLAVGVLGLLFLMGPSALHATGICDAIAGNLVTNCGFEGGVYTVGSNLYVPVGWTPNAAFADFTDYPFNHVTGLPNSGYYALQMGDYDYQPLAAISQTITDVSGATYQGSFYSFESGVGNDPSDFLSALIGSTTEKTVGDTDYYYAEFTFSFTGTGSDTLTFEAQSTPGEWYLDDVSIVETAPPPTTTPEPGTLVLLGGGLLGMGGLIRRKVRL
jgi:hypothetical protein